MLTYPDVKSRVCVRAQALFVNTGQIAVKEPRDESLHWRKTTWNRSSAQRGCGQNPSVLLFVCRRSERLNGLLKKKTVGPEVCTAGFKSEVTCVQRCWWDPYWTLLWCLIFFFFRSGWWIRLGERRVYSDGRRWEPTQENTAGTHSSQHEYVDELQGRISPPGGVRLHASSFGVKSGLAFY